MKMKLSSEPGMGSDDDMCGGMMMMILRFLLYGLWDRLYCAARALLRGARQGMEPADLLHTVLMRCARPHQILLLARMDPKGRFFYLLRAMFNEQSTLMRNKARQNELMAERAHELSPMARDERLPSFAEMVEGLDEQEAMLLKMRFEQGMTLNEMAEAMNVSMSTVSRDLRQAMQHVRETYEEPVQV